jgi:hypothetical protein
MAWHEQRLRPGTFRILTRVAARRTNRSTEPPPSTSAARSDAPEGRRSVSFSLGRMRSSMTEYRDRVFHSIVDRGESLSIHDVACHSCRFENCGFSLTKDPTKRSSVTDVTLSNCTVCSSDIGPAILRDVTIDGLTTDSLFIIWGALFEHVALFGRIGKVKINTHVHHSDQTPATQKPFDAERHEFYAQTDWALDISQAKVRLLEISGIPARLIRRDAGSQMVVRRERALQPDWRSRLSPDNKHWPFSINMFLSSGESDRVLVAPLLGPKKQTEQLLRELHELRDLGVVE